MDDFAIARVVHVIAIIAWIGGVAFVTLVIMPMLTASEWPNSRLARFAQIEGGFAWAGPRLGTAGRSERVLDGLVRRSLEPVFRG